MSSNNLHEETIGMSEDPYYFTVCDICGGITGAISMETDFHEALKDWQKDGRRVGYMTVPPRLSCTCGSLSRVTHEMLEATKIYFQSTDALEKLMMTNLILLQLKKMGDLK